MIANTKAGLLVLAAALVLPLAARAASPEAGVQLAPAPLLARPVAEPPDAVAASPAPDGKPLCRKARGHDRLERQGGRWLPTCAPSKAQGGAPGDASASQTAKPPHQ